MDSDPEQKRTLGFWSLDSWILSWILENLIKPTSWILAWILKKVSKPTLNSRSLDSWILKAWILGFSSLDSWILKAWILELGFLDSQSLDSWILELGFLDSQSFDSSNSEQFGLLNFQKLEFSKFQFFLLGDSFRLRPCLLVGIIFEKVKRELAAEPFCGLVFEKLHHNRSNETVCR